MSLIPRKIYFDDMLDSFMEGVGSKMKCDIYEKDDIYYIEMDIPGFTKEDISIASKNGYLTVKATRDSSQSEEDKDRKYICRERTYGQFERSFYLGEMNEENISASYRDGILKITVPKEDERDSRRVIEIQ